MYFQKRAFSALHVAACEKRGFATKPHHQFIFKHQEDHCQTQFDARNRISPLCIAFAGTHGTHVLAGFEARLPVPCYRRSRL